MTSRLSSHGWLLLLGILGIQLVGCGVTPPPQVMLGSLATAAQQKGQGCVEPTDVMRRSHMDFLLHQRDATVYEGIRTVKHSLKACIDCHVSHDQQNKPVAINAEGQFCQACHVYAAVKVDCFECHATKPGLVLTATPAVATPASDASPVLAVPVTETTPAVAASVSEMAPEVAAPVAQTPADPVPAVARPEEAASRVVPSGDLVPPVFQPVPVVTLPEN